MKDHYKTLGVSHSATAAQVEAAYQQVLDGLGKPDDITSFFLEPDAHITEAYEVLRNPTRRQAYDDELRASIVVQVTTSPKAVSAAPVTPPRPPAPAITTKRASPPKPPRPVSPSYTLGNPVTLPVPPGKSNLKTLPGTSATSPGKPKQTTQPATTSESSGWRTWVPGLAGLLVVGLLVWGGIVVVRAGLSAFHTASEWVSSVFSSDEPTVRYTGRVTSRSGLNMRAEPSKDADVVAKVPWFVTVEVLREDGPEAELDNDGRAGNWYQVTYEGTTGWVRGAYIERLGD